MPPESTWRWLRSGPGTPDFNMALDEALLKSTPARPLLRTYAWDPWSLSLGYFQEADPGAVRPLLAPGYGLVRRPTGGRVIFHGDELTYAVVVPAGDPVVPRDTMGAYLVLHGILIRALARVGVEAEFRGERSLASEARDEEEALFCFYDSTSFDLVRGNRKLVGSAQRRTRHGFLMHGSIPLSENPLTPRAAAAGASYSRLERALGRELEDGLGVRLEPAEPSTEEVSLARMLAERKFADADWTWRRTGPGTDEAFQGVTRPRCRLR